MFLAILKILNDLCTEIVIKLLLNTIYVQFCTNFIL